MPEITIRGIPINIIGINDILGTDTTTQPFFRHRVHGRSRSSHGVTTDTVVSITGDTWEQIRRTLSALPPSTLSLVDRIIFGDFPEVSGGGSALSRAIRINYRVFDPHIRPVNFNPETNPNLYLVTLLHEFGHKVNRFYHSLSYLREHHDELYTFLISLPISETRQTDFSEERYADAFMDYYRLGEYGMQTGSTNQRRYEALMSCPPFGD